MPWILWYILSGLVICLPTLIHHTTCGYDTDSGYQLIWVLWWCTVAGLLLQILAARLGVVTGLNLAQMSRKEYPRCSSMALWIMTEIAIIGSDIQEVRLSKGSFTYISPANLCSHPVTKPDTKFSAPISTEFCTTI